MFPTVLQAMTQAFGLVSFNSLITLRSASKCRGLRTTGRLAGFSLPSTLLGIFLFKWPLAIGFAVGPTWPKAAVLAYELLTGLTNQLVFGSNGPRIMSRNFNQPKPLEQRALGLPKGRPCQPAPAPHTTPHE